MAQLHNARRNACIVEADESMRIRMEGPPHKNHEDHIAGKGMSSLSHYNLVHIPSAAPPYQTNLFFGGNYESDNSNSYRAFF